MVAMLWCYLNNENTLGGRLVATFRIFWRARGNSDRVALHRKAARNPCGPQQFRESPNP